MVERPKKLLDQVHDAIRLKHYSYSTEKTYVHWVYRFILFHNKRHPKDMGASEVEAFLTYLAVKQNVSASTQNQAFCALIFLYRHVLRLEIDLSTDAVRAKRSRYLPTVLTQDEAIAVIAELSGAYQLVVKLLYSSGLRLSEALRLRVKDLDFGQRQIIVRDGKVGNSRVTMLPNSAINSLKGHLQNVQRMHHEDLNKGFGSVYLPYALERKYPNAERQWV